MGIKLSACTIAKNEALNIGKSIDSYKDYVDEIIIVDTGSIDETVKIAEEKGAKVLNFEWRNDFSAAKNFALDNATGDWIIFLDADEWFDGDSAKNIRTAIENAIKLNYNAVACKLVNFFTETEVLETASTIRVFKKAENIRFCRAIHEALFDTTSNIALPGIFSELFTVNHSGYMKGLVAKKAKRNKALLDKNFALGNATPIDYFYGIRENLQENVKVSEYFYKLMESVKDYDELISTFNITTSVDENKIKLTNLLNNKYSFEYRAKLLEDIQKKHVNNPTFKFYEYALFDGVDKKRAIKALQDAIEFDKTFEQDNLISSNPFYGKRSDVFSILGKYYLFINDKIKALDYFVQSIKCDYTNLLALWGVLNVISNEKTEDIVIFINSIYDISKKEVEEFLVDALRLTKFNEVFLYYFVDYYKKYEEVDKAYFTSRLLTGNFEEITDRYFEVYNENRDERALILISAALIAGNCKEKFLGMMDKIPYTYSKILRAYFNEQEIEKLTEVDVQIVLGIFNEVAYIADDEIIRRLINLSSVAKEKIASDILKHYNSFYSYDYVLKWIDEFSKDDEYSEEFKVFTNYLKVNIYFANNDFEKLPDCLDKVISGGLLDQDIVLICEMLEADDDKLQEYFELYDDLSFVKINMILDKVQDVSDESVKFMTVDKFKDDIKNKSISLLNEHLKSFFNFAEKLKKQKAFSLAEKYYRISVKYNYKVDKAYLALGEIYNYFGKPELSYYCYENAFVENFVLAKDILPKAHANVDYIFSKKAEKSLETCPICGKESSLINTYLNINDENLTYNDTLISKYRRCNECQHVFLENDMVNKDFWGKEDNYEVNNDNISRAYDVLESICEITDGDIILDCANNKEFEVAAINYGFDVEKDSIGKHFDIIFAGNTLDNLEKPEEKLKQYAESMTEDGIIIFEFYDEGNAFSKLAPKPFWARVGVNNVFSKKSIEILFSKFDLHILQISVDKINKGKMIVFAGK